MATSIDKLMELAKAYGWAAADHEHHQSEDTLDAMEMAEQELRAGLVALSAAPAPQPAQAEQTDARDAARWRYIAWHIGVAWNEQGFTSLVRIVSDKHREMLGDMVDRMMAGDWPEAAPKPAQPARCPQCNYQHGHQIGCENNPVDIALKAQGSKDLP